jgi:hypothetical protein
MSDDSAKTISANSRKPFRQSCRIVTYEITDSAKVDSVTVQMLIGDKYCGIRTDN